MEVEQGIRAIVKAVEAELPELAALVRTRLREEVAEFYVVDDPALSTFELETISSSLASILQGLADQRDVEDAVPERMLRQARLAAQANVSLHALLRKQRVAHAVMWDAFLEAAQRVVVDDKLRSTALRSISQYHFAWNDHVIVTLISEYEAEHRLYFTARSDRKKRAMVKAVLGGSTADENALGYPMGGRHLAIIAWGDKPEAVIRSIGTALGGNCLIVSGIDDAYFGWVHRATHSTNSDDDLASVVVPQNTQVACGQYANDLVGFRSSHVQAGRTYRVARLGTRPLTWYRNVSLEALVLRDLPTAHDFVRYELGPLLDASERSRVLLKTLKTYYELGQNAAATGVRLDINERTVAYRLRTIEELLGSTVWERREELGVAIRIAEIQEITPSVSPPT